MQTTRVAAHTDIPSLPPPPPQLQPPAYSVAPTTVVPAPTHQENAPAAPLPADTTAQAPTPPDDHGALLQAWVSRQQRLYRVGAPLLLKNTALCPLLARKIVGVTAKTQYSYSSDFVTPAKELLGLDDRLRVTAVLPGSGAEMSGILPGDFLLAVNDRALPQGPNAESAAGSILADATEGSRSLELTTLRDTDTTIVEVPLTPACAMVIDLGNSDAVSSYADGRRVMVTRGMLDFVRSDNELAYVLAREIAFNIAAGTPRPDVGAVIDQLHTLNTGTMVSATQTNLAPVTPALDATVEKLSLYLLARAGYKLDGVRDFWERLASAYPADGANSHAALHPPIGDRLAIIDKILPTVAMKLKTKQALTP